MNTYSAPVYVDIDEIDESLRPATEIRVRLDAEAIERYREGFSMLPPVKLMTEKGGHHWVVDGAHTITAARLLRKKTVCAIVKVGTYVEAFEEASHCNSEHGVPITNADKRHRVELACKVLPGRVTDWPWTARRLAKFCGVTHPTVSEVLSQLETVSNSECRTGSDGKKYTQGNPRQPRKSKDDSTSDPKSASSNGKPAPKPKQPPAGAAAPAQPSPEAPPSPGDTAEPESEQPFDFDGAWDEIEDYILAEFKKWPKEYRVIFIERLDGTRANVAFGVPDAPQLQRIMERVEMPWVTEETTDE